MKRLLTFVLSFSFALNSYAQSSPNEAETYWQWSQNQNQDAESVDQCLERIYASQSLQICSRAVADLTQIPLSPHRREVLTSLLQKIPMAQLTKQQSDLLKGILLTFPELNTDSLPAKQNPPTVSSLEVKAWLKVLAKKTNLQQAMVSLNGQAPKQVGRMQALQGIYQWTLLAPGLEPIVVVGTWNDFSTQLGNLKSQSEEKNWMPSAQKTYAEHLGDLPSMPEGESTDKAATSHTWVWVTLLAVGAGVAAATALKDKTVSVTWPGQH